MEGRSSPYSLARARSLNDLRARIEAVEHHRLDQAAPSMLTGWGPPLETLACGVLHEWFSPTAPLLIFAHLIRCAQREEHFKGWIIWIGRRVWPQPHALIGPDNECAVLARSLLVDPSCEDNRLWAIDLCLRSPAVAAVIADGGGLKLSHTRRLQLAAECGRTLALLARPVRDLSIPSAAATRWRVSTAPSSTARPRWQIELVRCKGVRRGSGMDAGASLFLEHHRATGCLPVSSALADRPAQAPARRAG